MILFFLMLRDGIWPEGVYNVMFGLKFENYCVEFRCSK